MRSVLPILTFLILSASPASSQAPCFPGTAPDGGPVSFQQWYGVCGESAQQVCAYMQSITPVANCTAMIQTQYQSYVYSVRAVNSMPQCTQFSLGAQLCFGGWVRVCNGQMWEATANRCGG